MTQQIINIGLHPSDGSGDPIRVSFDKINQNFTELYTTIGGSGGIVTPGTVTSVAGKEGAVVLTVADVAGAVSKPYVDARLGELVEASVAGAFNEIIDAAPEALNTLRELAAAVSNNPQFALSIMDQLADRLSKSAGGTMAAPLFLHGDPTSELQATTKQYVDLRSAEHAANLARSFQDLVDLLNDKAETLTVNQQIASLNSTLSALIATKAAASSVTALQSAVASKAESSTVLSIQGQLIYKADASTVYPKEMVYTKAEIDTRLSQEADIGTVYTKAEVDSLLLNITSNNDSDWGSIAVPADNIEDYGSI